MFFILLTSIVLVSGQPLQEIAIDLNATADSYIAEDKPQWKAGTEDYLIIGYTKHIFQKDCELRPGGGYYQKKIYCNKGYHSDGDLQQ